MTQTQTPPPPPPSFAPAIEADYNRTHINFRQETERTELRHLQECRELRETIEVMRKKLEAVRKASA